MNFSVTAALDAHIERTEKPRLPDGKWHPSAIFGCARQAVYGVRGVPVSDPRDARSKRVLRIGTTLHEVVQDAIASDPTVLSVWNEVSIDIPDLNVVGAADSVVLLEAGDLGQDTEYELEEIKSINSKAFKYGDLPKPDHVEQARAYAYGLRRLGGTRHVKGCARDSEPPACRAACSDVPTLGDRLKRIRITYLSKDDLYTAEFTVDIDEEWEAKFEERIAWLDKYRADGEVLPPRLPLEKGKKNWRCNWCDWRTRCWDEDPEGVEL